MTCAIVILDNCIHMAVKRVSDSKSICKIWRTEYEDKKKTPIRIAICVAGPVSFPSSKAQGRVEILTTLNAYKKYLENRPKFPFESAQQILGHFLPFIEIKYDLGARNYIAANYSFGIGASIGDSLGIAELNGDEAQPCSDYLEMAVPQQEAKLNMDSRSSAEKFKHFVSVVEAKSDTVSQEKCDIISISKERITTLQLAPRENAYEKSITRNSVLAPRPSTSVHSPQKLTAHAEEEPSRKIGCCFC